MDAAGLLAELKDKLLGRVPNALGVGCILCQHILSDLAKHGMLTGKVPEPTFDGKPTFPVEGKILHLWLEGFWTNEIKNLIKNSLVVKP